MKVNAHAVPPAVHQPAKGTSRKPAARFPALRSSALRIKSVDPADTWAIIDLYPLLSTTSNPPPSYQPSSIFDLHSKTMHPIRPLRMDKQAAPSRSFTAPLPADEPQPGSPISDSSSFFEGAKESVVSLHNPWPPTPPQLDSPTSSTPTVNGCSRSQEALLSSPPYVPS